MARTEVGKFEHDLAELCKRHSVVVGAVVYHPNETEGNRIDVLSIGRPSPQWLACAGEVLFRHVENLIMSGGVKSKIQGGPEDITSRREENYTDSGLMQHLMKKPSPIIKLGGN